MRRPQLKSTFARAVAPVLAGIGFILVVGLLLWGVAAVISHNRKDTTENLSRSYQEMGTTTFVAGVIDDGGPLVLKDLIGNDRNIVVDHTGTDVNENWSIYLAHPADRDASCAITLVKHTHTFTDCEGRTLTVDQLATVPDGVGPIVDRAAGTLTLDLTATAPATSDSTMSDSTTSDSTATSDSAAG